MALKNRRTKNEFDRKYLLSFWGRVPPGQERRFHHCKDGHNNDKFYIKKLEENNGLIAHCFHCGKSGYAFTDEVASNGHKYISKEPPKTSPISWRDLRNEKVIAGDAYKYLSKLGRSKENSSYPTELVYNNFVKGGTDWLAVPVGNMDNMRGKGYQIRYFNNPELPKWIQRSTGKNSYVMCWSVPEVIVIVEDYFSALSIFQSNNSKIGSLWLGGVGINEEQIQAIGRYDNVTALVWLDNDNTQVKLAAHRICTKLEKVGIPNLIEDRLSDPKSYTRKELADSLGV